MSFFRWPQLWAIFITFLSLHPTLALDCEPELRQKICKGNSTYCTGEDHDFEDLVVEIAKEASPLVQKLFCDVTGIRIVRPKRDPYAGEYTRYSEIITVRSDFQDPITSENESPINDTFGYGYSTIIQANGRPFPRDEGSMRKFELTLLLVHELAHHMENVWLNKDAYRCTNPVAWPVTAKLRRAASRAATCRLNECSVGDWRKSELAPLMEYVAVGPAPSRYALTNAQEDFAEMFELYQMIEYYGYDLRLNYADGSLALDQSKNLHAEAKLNKVRLMRALEDLPERGGRSAEKWVYDHMLCQGNFDRKLLNETK